MLDRLDLLEEDIRRHAIALRKTGRLLADHNLVQGHLGTISVSLEKGVYLVKEANCVYEFAKLSNFIIVDGNGQPLDGTRRTVSANFWVHVAIYEALPWVKAIAHAHPVHLVALISQIPPGETDPPKHMQYLGQEIAFTVQNFHIPIVEDLDPAGLTSAVAEKVLGANVVLIRNHGIMAIGYTIQEAYSAIRVVEAEAERINLTKGTPLFRTPQTLREDLKVIPAVFHPRVAQ